MLSRAGPHVRPEQPSSRSRRLDILVLESCGVRFALPCSFVEQRLTDVHVRSVPLAPSAVAGIVERGTCWVPVLDVARRLGRRLTEPRGTGEVVLVRAGSRLVGFRSERPIAKATVATDDLEQREGPSSTRGTLEGTCLLDDGIALIQAPRAFLSDTESAELDVALALLGIPDETP